MSALSGIGGLARSTRALPTWSVRRVVAVYVGAIGVAELVGALASSPVAAAIHAGVVLALVEHYLRVARGDGDGTSAGNTQALLLVLATVPLTRVIALGLPAEDLGQHPYAVAGAVPLLLAPLLAAWLLPVGPFVVLHSTRDLRAEGAVALAGVLLGLAAALAFDIDPLVADPSAVSLAAAVIGVFLVAGVAEELVFRGLLQRALVSIHGYAGIPIAAGVFALGYAGAGLASLLFAWVIGLFYGAHADRQGSIAGVAVSHGLLATGALVIWPLIV